MVTVLSLQVGDKLVSTNDEASDRYTVTDVGVDFATTGDWIVKLVSPDGIVRWITQDSAEDFVLLSSA